MARTTQRLGPYRLVSELGAGGMGTVWLAEVAEPARGLAPGTRVAIKVVHPHLLGSPGFFKRFLREGEMGRRVVHENVVRTFDLDALTVEGRQVNYLVMEYVEGRNLRELLGDLGVVPESLLREIALQVASGLAAIHAAGIVHRDIRPDNILLADDHRVRVMDLGVAKAAEASTELTGEGRFAGSPHYAAPEQFAGTEVGPAVDLYALGVVLYELATGENPFRREGAPAVIAAHLEHDPPLLSRVNPAISEFFSEVVARLLRKAPAERFSSAEELHRVLAEEERTDRWALRTPPSGSREERLPAIRVRRETSLHGRAPERRVLAECWESAKAGRGSTVWLEGEAGIGKTRLLDAFLGDLGPAAAREAHILYGSYPPSGGLGGLSEAILGKFGEADLARALAPYLRVTPRLAPAFAALVRHESPPAGAETVRGDALHAVCTHLMRELSAEKPLLWIVEDLHFAPKESRELMLSLARAAPEHRVLLVATARPGVPEDELAHFGRLESFRRLHLGRLATGEVESLLGEALRNPELARALAGRIARQSDGVPFFVFELLRTLADGGFLRAEEGGRRILSKPLEQTGVPPAVRDLIQGRLAGLTDAQRTILDAGAVAGLSFDPGLVAEVLELRRVHVLQQLAEVERKTGLVCGEAGRCRFDQNQIQEVLYGALPPDLRSEYHALLAEAFARRLPAAPAGEDHVFLAGHHLRGSRPENCLPHLMPALDHLGLGYRSEAAIRLAGVALAVPGLLSAPRRVEALLAKAGHHDLRGESAARREALEEAQALADAAGDPLLRARVRVALGAFLTFAADHAAARARLEEARVLAREAGDRRTEGRVAGNLGVLFWNQDRYEEARTAHAEHLSIARETGDRRGEAAATGNLGLVARSLGRTEDARALFEEHMTLARALGDRRGEAVAASNLGLLLLNRGRPAEALEQLRRSLALSREIGHRAGEAAAEGNLGLVLENLGRGAEARAHFLRWRSLARETGDRRNEAAATGCLGNLLWRGGRYAEAKALFETCLSLARETGDRRGESVATGNLGGVLWSEGRYEEARTLNLRWLALAREIGNRSDEALAVGNSGLILLHEGRREEARHHMEDGLSLARGTGNRGLEARALAALGTLAEAEEDEEEATRRHSEALAIRRELGDRAGTADSLVSLAGIRQRGGDPEGAAPLLAEASALAEGLEAPDLLLLLAVARARGPGKAPEEALAALERHGERVPHDVRLAARFALWEITGDTTHLREARRLLRLALDGVPPEHRAAMARNVPLHRAILAAGGEETR